MTERQRTVNQALGLQPRFGPVPSDQLFPWLTIAFTFYLVFNQALRFSWLWTGLLIFWACGTWWLLTGSRAYRFLGKFIASPNWTRGRQQYRPLQSVIAEQDQLVQERRELRSQKQVLSRSKAKTGSTRKKRSV